MFSYSKSMENIDIKFDARAQLAQFIMGTTKHCYIQNIEALGLLVSGKIFLVFPIVSLWELPVAIETKILIQAAPQPNAITPLTQ